jgi:probable rRNA maturation factor
MVSVSFHGRRPACLAGLPLGKLLAASYRLAGWSGPAGVSVVFVSEPEMRRLNRERRGLDRPTDVLSFAYRELDRRERRLADEDGLGDIVVCPSRVRRQAAEIGRSCGQELALVIVHGFLHLLGFDHDTPVREKKMFQFQHEVLLRAKIL